jgi:Methyltransferase FkbM domain
MSKQTLYLRQQQERRKRGRSLQSSLSSLSLFCTGLLVGSIFSVLFGNLSTLSVLMTSPKDFIAGDAVAAAIAAVTFPQPHQRDSPLHREPRLGDGCYHVFVDIGANIGVHGRFLLEPHLYNNTDTDVDFFDQQYGFNRSNEDFCVFEMEANPKRWPRLHQVSDAYQKHRGWRYHVVEAAASDQTGNMTFYKQGDDIRLEWGFTISKNTSTGPHVGEIQVKTLRLASWLQHEIFERHIPTIPPSQRKYYKRPIVGMKMDIESSEYLVLPDMALTGAFCQLDFVFGEFHSRNAVDVEGQPIPLSTPQQAQEFEQALLTTLKSSRNCHTPMYVLDDESYLFDGQALPQ